jgi:hypothetical protein
MAHINEQQLIDHLDNSLQGKASAEMDRLIAGDQEAAGEWAYLRMAVAAIQDAGLQEQVKSVKREFLAQKFGGLTAVTVNTEKIKATTRTAAVPMFRKAMRIAAMLLVIGGAATIYKYTTTSPTGLYNRYYASYDLNASRSNNTLDPIEQAYNDKNWMEVVALFNRGAEKNHKSYFLAGMAELEMKRYFGAIEKFKLILAENAQSGNDYFQDEAEYYLALSWLAADQADKAIPILDKIKADKNHLYHATVEKMSSIDLHIVQYKNGK